MMMMMYDRVDLYYNLMRLSIFMTIHINVLCDDGHIMTHINEKNDNAGDMYTIIIIITVMVYECE